MPFRSYFIPSELVKSEFVSLGNYSKGFHAASNRFEGSHIIENWKHFQGQNYVTKRTCGDRGELGLSKSRAVEICDQIFLFFSKKISSRFDMMRIVVVAHFFFFFFFFSFYSATTCVMRLQSGHSWHLEAFSSRQAHLRCCNCVKHYAGKRKPLEMQIFAAGVIKALVEWK